MSLGSQSLKHFMQLLLKFDDLTKLEKLQGKKDHEIEYILRNEMKDSSRNKLQIWARELSVMLGGIQQLDRLLLCLISA